LVFFRYNSLNLLIASQRPRRFLFIVDFLEFS